MATTFGIDALERALADLGALLDERGLKADLFVIGGAAFLLSDPDSAPPTRDVDAAARLEGLEPVHPILSREIADAIDVVGRIHGIGPGWISAAAANSRQNLLELQPSDAELDAALAWYLESASDPGAVIEPAQAVVAGIREALHG